MFDEELLAGLDRTEEVREKGRFAVLRQIISDFLRRRRQKAISLLRTVLVAPITSAIYGAPSEVQVGIEEGLRSVEP
jgi:hypothetical protein